MSQELPITVYCIDPEDTEVADICADLIRCCPHNEHSVIILTFIQGNLIIRSVMCIHDACCWTQLIPVVPLPHIQLSVVPVAVEHTEVHVAPESL